jgi:diguanylate cyclase (GGDEF)-like protein
MSPAARKEGTVAAPVAIRDSSVAARCSELLIEHADALRAEVLQWQMEAPHRRWLDNIPLPLREAVERLLGVALDAALKADAALRILAEHAPDRTLLHAADLLAANENLVLAAMQTQTKMQELARASQRDVLTDTPNRTLMLDRFKYAIAMAQRHAKQIAVFFVDLDDFKLINDTHGHAVGDAVLQRVARQLESAVRASDTVSRHGGDEFLVLLSEVSHRPDVTAIAAKILSALAKPGLAGDRMPPISASVGISIYPNDGTEAAVLINRADAAMYRAKAAGHNRFECYVERLDFARSESLASQAAI